ncbi:MAG: DEAD/DEAH box helicase family protein [Saprospiraceae bacterium]
MSHNPILNNPYLEPLLHYATDLDGTLNYQDIRNGRRIFTPGINAMPTRQDQSSLFEVNDHEAEYGTHIINLCRKEVGKWRNEKYPGVTRISRELLTFWFDNPEREVYHKLFFAQQETIETAIWLNEVAEKSNAGQHIINLLRTGQHTAGSNPVDQLPRMAFKMATGTGKTVVMGCFIVYHFFNRQEYRNDTRFVDYFLIVAPGITIKDRLGVLVYDVKNKHSNQRDDYYHQRNLVPSRLEKDLDNLNARLVITNYHTFEPKILQGNKRSPFDGKVDLQGKKIDTGNKEDFSLVIKRMMSSFKSGSRLLILNDEAHHCYLPKSSGKTTDNEESDENERAAVWFRGLREISQRYKVNTIYDLSATPYYLQGSGYDPYSLFSWVVTDFGLIEAIESGLVKIPFLPESDDAQSIEMPVLRNLYEHVKDELPRKGQRKKKADAKVEGKKVKEEPPKLPVLVKAALDQFYNHYVEYYNGHRKQQETRPNLFSPPPVFILVCNNTSVSKEVYKYIAGYEYVDEESGDMIVYPGAKELFSNYDATRKPLQRPPTLIIDSDALENSNQINEDFRKIFFSEIEEFKKDYVRVHGHGSSENITEAELLREVVNTVGRQGKLGSHIRCVVSVSMLTEGWDANTVTHIMGLRAFGSQLLCEQVAGRALRRMSYVLQGYDKEGNPTTDKRKIAVWKYPPEYAHIIGIPFKLFKGGAGEGPPEPQDLIHIKALPERQAQFEIEFPNIVGYRIDNIDEPVTWDFSGLENFEIDGSLIPLHTFLKTAFSNDEIEIRIESAKTKRDAEIIFSLTRHLLNYHFGNDEGAVQFQKFNHLRHAVAEWYDKKIALLNIQDPIYKKLIDLYDPKTVVDHIARGINTHRNTKEIIRPVFNYYNPFSSTKYVSGHTSKEVYPTIKSHVNYVVADTESWEQIAAKTLEQLPEVERYVKNAFLGFTIPYTKDGKDAGYYPDFIAQVKDREGVIHNLIIEITGMNKEKAEKKWYVEHRWLPAVNAVRENHGYPAWHFIEIANDIRNIKNELSTKISSLSVKLNLNKGEYHA